MAFAALVPMEGQISHLPTVFTFLQSMFPALGDSPAFRFLLTYERQVFSLLMVLVVSLVVVRLSRRLEQRPGIFQNAVEMIVESFDGFVRIFLGEKHCRRFLPYLGTLFLFILLNNWMGLVPFFTGATSFWGTTGALAIMTFLLVQFVAMTELGPAKYFHHMCGEPTNIGMWIIGVVMIFPIHVVGELAKPLSLALRLFGNILGEHLLLGAFMGFGVAIMTMIGLGWLPILPLHLPFLFLALLMSTIQALIFMLLSMVYIQLVLPHEEEHAH
jgi:F-type H+-transporting ATPase subunit a